MLVASGEMASLSIRAGVMKMPNLGLSVPEMAGEAEEKNGVAGDVPGWMEDLVWRVSMSEGVSFVGNSANLINRTDSPSSLYRPGQPRGSTWNA